jgi:hypothetical protein
MPFISLEKGLVDKLTYLHLREYPLAILHNRGTHPIIFEERISSFIRDIADMKVFDINIHASYANHCSTLPIKRSIKE